MDYYRQPPSDTLHALDSTPDGSGIGVSLSRQIMQLHGGSLRLTGNTDRRVTFTLQIG